MISPAGPTLIANSTLSGAAEGVTFDPALAEFILSTSQCKWPRTGDETCWFNATAISSTTDEIVRSFPLVTTTQPPFQPAGTVPAATFDPENGLLYFPEDFSYESLIAVNPANWTVSANITLPGPIGTPVYDPYNLDLYAPALYENGNLTIISGQTDQVMPTVVVGSNPGVPVIDPVDRDVYVPCQSNLSIISSSSNSVVASIPIEVGISPPTFDPSTGDLYGTDAYDDEVDVFNASTNALLQTIPVGVGASPVAYDSWNGQLYVSDGASGVVTVIGGNRSVEVIPSATAVPLDPIVGQATFFSAHASGGAQPYAWTWRFGDGSQSSTRDSNHSFESAGQFYSRVWVNDSDGRSTEIELVVDVKPPPVASSEIPLTLAALVVTLALAVVAAILILSRGRRRGRLEKTSAEESLPSEHHRTKAAKAENVPAQEEA